ncbi:MAG TPA: hypothetical protein VJC08_00330 [bacterium]|nr:hypothetical protein [bacterium]
MKKVSHLAFGLRLFFIELSTLGGSRGLSGLAAPEPTIFQRIFSFTFTYALPWLVNFSLCWFILKKKTAWGKSVLSAFVHLCLPLYAVWIALSFLMTNAVKSLPVGGGIERAVLIGYDLIFLSLVPALIIAVVVDLIQRTISVLSENK